MVTLKTIMRSKYGYSLQSSIYKMDMYKLKFYSLRPFGEYTIWIIRKKGVGVLNKSLINKSTYQFSEL